MTSTGIDKLTASGISREDMAQILADPAAHYRTYRIPKRDGSHRQICAPSPKLAAVLRSLLPFVRGEAAVSRQCMAYERGCSTLANAKLHMRGRYVLRVDIHKFFGSIDKEMVLGTYFRRHDGHWSQEAEDFWRLVSFDGGLPIGAPTSPFIANRVMLRLDRRLAKIGWGIRYSRYADDMIFSAKKPLSRELGKKIEDIIRQFGLRINNKKTMYMHRRREVTGIIITDSGQLSVGTSFKKRLKSDIFNLLVHGKGNRAVVRGRYAHLAQIEPAYARKIATKYGPMDNINFFGKKK